MFHGDGNPIRRLLRKAVGAGTESTAVVKRLAGIAALGLALMPAATGGVHGDVPEKIYTYSVIHPTHGDIGIFQNSILDDGAQVSVRNDIRIQVKILLVVAHSETTKSEEVWKKGRLISFSGTTQENGKKTIVTGEAEGAKFVVEAPDGPKVAPASVFPNNPWSKSILNATVLLGTKSGKLYQVRAEPGEEREIDVSGRKVATEYFRVLGDAKYELWFDDRGIAVKFTELGEHGTITFKLVSETIQPASASAKAAGTSG